MDWILNVLTGSCIESWFAGRWAFGKWWSTGLWRKQMDQLLDGLWQRYWEVAKSRMRGPTERSRWRMGFYFALVPSCIPPPRLSFSLLIVHLESDLLLPLTFIQPILGFTVVSDWLPQMTVSQNTWNPGPKFIQFPKWSLQLFCDISNKTDSYSLNPICSLKYFIFIYWLI